MAVDFDRGYEVDVLVIGGVAVYVGTSSPDENVIVNAPVNSIYFQSNGAIWQKTGAGDTAANWTVALAAAPPIVTVTDTDYTVAAGVAHVRVKAVTKELTITIPTATVERILDIKVVTNADDEFNVYLITPDSSLIEDETDAVIQCEKTAVTLWANGTDWEVVAR